MTDGNLQKRQSWCDVKMSISVAAITDAHVTAAVRAGVTYVCFAEGSLMHRHNGCCRVAMIVSCTSGKLVMATEVALPVVAIMQRAQLPLGST